MIRSEELWTVVELSKINHTTEAADIMIDLEEDMETEMLAQEVTMAVYDTGKSTPMVCRIMLIKSMQGGSCSCLLKVLHCSGRSR